MIVRARYETTFLQVLIVFIAASAEKALRTMKLIMRKCVVLRNDDDDNEAKKKSVFL